jgi:hypothetical protein
LVFHAVFVHLESFALKLLLVVLVARLLMRFALFILRGVIVHFERFSPSRPPLLKGNTRLCGGFPDKSGPPRSRVHFLTAKGHR